MGLLSVIAYRTMSTVGRWAWEWSSIRELELGKQMAELMLIIGFSLSSGALVLFMGVGAGRFHSRRSRIIPQGSSMDCLGQMAKRHCEYCSTECPVAARCVLLVMDVYMRKHPEILSSQDPFEQF